jgi:hypothetical protein
MRASHTVYVTDGQYVLLDDGGTAHPNPGPALDTAVDQILFPDVSGNSGVYLMPGRFEGPVDITMETLDAPPGTGVVGDGWEHSEELTATGAGSSVFVATLSDRVAELPELAVQPGTRYGVRLLARGVEEARDRGDLEWDETPVESHLIQLWREA